MKGNNSKIAVYSSLAFAGGLIKKTNQKPNPKYKLKIQTNPQSINISKILGDFICFAFQEPYTII